MKLFSRTIFAAILASGSLLLAGCGQKPLSYHDKVIGIVEQSEESYVDYKKQINNIDIAQIDEIKDLRQAAIVAQDEIIDDLAEIGSFKDSSAFIDSATEYVTTLRSILDQEEKELIDVWSQANEQGATESIIAAEDRVVTTIQEKIDASLATVQQGQEDFAAEHGIELKVDVSIDAEDYFDF